MAQPKDSAAMAAIRAQLLDIQAQQHTTEDPLIKVLLAILDEIKK